uniref:Uncharacterized protein n=1 Tax=Tetranychus urticae TaxID=32264 RepID=T1KTL9_TETUR
MTKTLEKTKFAEAQIILVKATEAPDKDCRQKWWTFLFTIDHCFSIKDKGSVILRLNSALLFTR